MARSSSTQMVRESVRELVADVKVRGSILGTGLATLWTVHVVNALLFSGGLASFGIVPRSTSGLLGILFAPFLHGSLAHLANNSVAFVWLGLLTMLRTPADLARVTVVGGLVAGLGAWLFGGPGTVHIGFSGVLFAYLGFLLTRGWFERSFGSIAVSALSLFWFGSMVWGVLPTTPGVSWQSHLFGFLGGILAASSTKRPKRTRRRS